VGKIRERLAHGGIALLALVFALAFAAFNLASALAREVVSALQQHTIDSEGGGGLRFRVAGTTFSYDTVLWYAITLALLASGLFGLWVLTRGTTRVCPECSSQVPRSASICRFCTSELGPDIADA
jgi:large conductance mechanosensitive channel